MYDGLEGKQVRAVNKSTGMVFVGLLVSSIEAKDTIGLILKSEEHGCCLTITTRNWGVTVAPQSVKGS